MHKFLLSHIAIIFISILLSCFNPQSFSLIIILFVITLICYFVSGYIFTQKKISIYKYFIVSFVGIFLWLICFLISPHSTLWKVSGGAGIWLFYEIYIYPEYLLRSVNFSNYDVHLDLFRKGIFPLIFSIMQLFGGLLKIKNIKTAANSGLAQ
jgi:hypothetical protein